MSVEYDPELEVLTMLGTMPVPIRLLVQDMNFSLQRDVYTLLKRLQKRGFEICTGMIEGTGERGVFVSRSGFEHAFRAAWEYATGREE